MEQGGLSPGGAARRRSTRRGGDASAPTGSDAAPAPLAADLAGARTRLAKDISAYPGSVTYLDLMRRNRRESVLLVCAMIALAGVVGAAIAAAISGYGMGLRDFVPSLIIGTLAGLLFAGIGSVWSWFGGAGAILKMSGAREIRKEDDPELFNVVDEMRIAAGLPMPRVFFINETALNAFATGRDPKHAAVAITRGLRERLTRDELQGVIAHEVAHIRHLDIRFAMLMATMVGLIVFACDAFLRIGLHGGLRHGRRAGGGKGGNAGTAVFVILALLLAVLAPFLARFIQMSYSRRREYLADAGAVELTRYPEGLAGALLKISGDPEPLVEAANRGTAHLFISNPLKKARQAKGQLDSAFSSHPPVQQRIARLLALTR